MITEIIYKCVNKKTTHTNIFFFLMNLFDAQVLFLVDILIKNVY